MNARRFQLMITAGAATLLAAATARAQVTYEDGPDGVKYEVRTVPRQMLVYENRDQTQTTYKQEVKTETYEHQQVYTVPVTQYQLVNELHGRWNPFVTPYWTQRYQPVTTWQQQVAKVQIPVTRVVATPETRTVQAPVATYKTVNQIIKTPIGMSNALGGGSTSALAARPLSSAPTSGGWTAQSPATQAASQPTATIASLPASSSIGGQKIEKDPPPQPSGWGDDRYNRR